MKKSNRVIQLLEFCGMGIIGGHSLIGGRGSIVVTLLGAVLIGILRNSLNLLNVGSYVQKVVLGIVILLAVLIDQMRIK
jgi:ribose/xylose/arabinose/galactoside ABC-type transport system permease subunit